MDALIESLYQNLTLIDQEDDTIHMEGQQFKEMTVWTGKCLVLRLLKNKYYNIQAFWKTMRRAWRLP